MSRNRFRQQAAPAPLPGATAFLLYPLSGMTADVLHWQVALYQWAYSEAEAVVSPSLPERDLLGVWN